MKKRVITGVAIAALLVAQVMTTFGAKSGSSTSFSPTIGKPTVGSSVVSVGSTGVKTTQALTSAAVAGGSSISIVVNTTTPSGNRVSLNSNGEAVIDDQAISFAKDGAATAGLPEDVVADINAINSGAALSSIIGGFDLTTFDAANEEGELEYLGQAPLMDLTGYHALTGTTAIVTKDAATGVVEDRVTEVVIYVPNLLASLQNVRALYYDNGTGRWLLLAPTNIDPVRKLVYVNVTGSGTLTIVHKK